jgi:protein-S-isoprenylcysteine O-methyltransferase Ste14
MTPIRLLWLLLALAWLAGERHLAVRSPTSPAKAADSSPDRGSLTLLWTAALLGLTTALAVKGQGLAVMPGEFEARQTLALLLFAAGVGLRFWAAALLGRFFTHRVQLHGQHRLIRSGPYRWVRHPAYSGLLLAFAGAGIAMGDWLALALTTLPLTVAVLYRVRIEEAALRAHFPDEFDEYSRDTYRMIPLVF